MKRRGQSASIAIIFIALMFISAFATLYTLMSNFRDEVRSKENRIDNQVDKVREKIICWLEKSTLVLYNDWTKYSIVRYVILLKNDRTISKILETNLTIQPNQRIYLDLQNGTSKTSVVTSLGNIFPIQEDPEGPSTSSYGETDTLDGTIPVRLFVNSDNATAYFIVEGLNKVHHFSANGSKVRTYYTDAYRHISDTPYRAWVYQLMPVYPMSNSSGWTGYNIVSYDKGYSSGGFYGDNLLFHDWILSPADEDNQYNSTAYSLVNSVPLNFVAQCVSGYRIIGVSASDYGGKTTYVMHALLDKQTSSYKVYKTNVTLSSFIGTRYYVWSYYYPYFVTRIYGANPDIVTVYKFINDSRAIKIFTARYSGSTQFTSYFVGNGYFYSYNYTSNGIVVGARNLQTLQWRTLTLPYKPFVFKYINYGLVFLKLNGFEIYNPDLTLAKNMRLPEGTSWYYPQTTFSSEFISDGGDWGYEFFQYQLAFLDQNTVLVLLMNSEGRAEVFKIHI